MATGTGHGTCGSGNNGSNRYLKMPGAVKAVLVREKAVNLAVFSI